MSEEVFEQIRITRDNMIGRMKLVGNEIILKILDEAKEIVDKEIAEKAVKDKEREHFNSQKRYNNGTSLDQESLAQEVLVKTVGQFAAADAEQKGFDGEHLSDNLTDQSCDVIWEPMDTLLDSDDTVSADYLDHNNFCFS
jgi:DNA transposition AAA+ family ATPase